MTIEQIKLENEGWERDREVAPATAATAAARADEQRPGHRRRHRHALRQRLDRGLNVDVPGTRVTTRPPDQVRDREANQVNLFLYQTTPNAAWRNIDLPGRSSTGSEPAGPPPLALNLYYLVSAYGRDGDDLDPISHRLLARGDGHPARPRGPRPGRDPLGPARQRPARRRPSG